MSESADESGREALRIGEELWKRVFMVAPLVIVGTIEEDGRHDLAPKHMAMPLGWGEHYCFACSPSHATQRNAERTGAFTVSYPRPDQIVASSLTASPRDADDSKPAVAAFSTVPAAAVDGVLVAGAYLWLECELDRVLDGYGENSLIIGRVVAAAADADALRGADVDDAELLARSPLLAYLPPGRFAEIGETRSFPFPADFRR
jgi:flavin reductase (DIM6/NTAB) family NADH-FMN oxidoreductase RutF